MERFVFNYTARQKGRGMSILSIQILNVILNVFYQRNSSILNHENPFKSYKFSKDVSKKIYAGGTVVYLAFQLAYHLGFGEVILLGVVHKYNYKVSNKDKNLYKVDNDN